MGGPAAAWTTQFGSHYDDRVTGLARDSTGTYVAGGAYGQLPGGVARGSSDVFLMKLDPNGTHVWTSQFGNTGDESATGVAADGNGAVYLVGTADQAIYGQTSFGLYDGFIRRYNANGGGRLRVCRPRDRPSHPGVATPGLSSCVRFPFTTNGNSTQVRSCQTNRVDAGDRHQRDDGVTSVAVDAAGEYAVAGLTSGALGGTNAGSPDAFVRRIEATGATLWTAQIGESLGRRSRRGA